MHTKFCLAVLTMLSLGCGFPPAAKWKVRNSFYINLYYIFYWKKKKIISGIRHCSQLLSCFPGFTYFLEKSSFKSWITIFYRKFGFDKVRPFRFNLFNVSKKAEMLYVCKLVFHVRSLYCVSPLHAPTHLKQQLN